jgi:hypothetical protein
MVAGKVGGHGVKLDKLLGDRNYLEGYILRPSKEGEGQRSVRRGVGEAPAVFPSLPVLAALVV